MKKIFLAILISCLFLPISASAGQTNTIELTQKAVETESWLERWIIRPLVYVLMGGIPPTAIINDPNVILYTEQLEKSMESAETAILELKKHHNVSLSLETLQAYYLKAFQLPKPNDLPKTEEGQRIAAQFGVLIDIHTAENSKISEDWLSKAATYDDLQQKFYRAQPSTLKPALRYLGYTGVFLLGPYLGNRLYTKFLDNYFSQVQNNHSDMMQKIMHLEEQCDITKAKLKLAETKLRNATAAADASTENKLKHSITKLEQTLLSMKQEIEMLTLAMELPEEASAWRTYAGIGVRVSMIALTTYLFYTIFKKIDENYLVQHPLPSEELTALTQEISTLESLKGKYNSQNVTLKELEKILLALKDKNAGMMHYISNLRQAFQHIKDLKENLGKAQAQAASHYLPGLAN